MSIKINGNVVEEHYVEFAAEIVPGVVIECDNEDDARAHAAVTGGKVMVRHIYETAYAEVAA